MKSRIVIRLTLLELDTIRFRKAGTVWLRCNSARSTWESASAYTMANLTPYVRKDS